jgi:hypothetical protein
VGHISQLGWSSSIQFAAKLFFACFLSIFNALQFIVSRAFVLFCDARRFGLGCRFLVEFGFDAGFAGVADDCDLDLCFGFIFGVTTGGRFGLL